jgi:hypothetical protein
MNQQFMKYFPLEAVPLEMEPEDLTFDAQQRNGTFNRTNFGLVTDVPLPVLERLMEGWMFLEREGLIAPDPLDRTGLWYFITRRGQSVKAEEDFKAYIATQNWVDVA